MSIMTMRLFDRVRGSGKFAPSLISAEQAFGDDAFEAEVMKVLEPAGFSLAPDIEAADAISGLLQKIDSIAPTTDAVDKRGIEQRRSIILAILGGTPSDSPSLARVLESGYLNHVKFWLEDALHGSIGSVDFLLHLLSNIADLPVTKNTVKNSGMGKVIGAIEKHKICKGTPNEKAILDRVQQIKEAWNASVKSRKSPESAKDLSSSIPKRPMVPSGDSPPASKRVKTTEEPKKSSFSSLLKKVSSSPRNGIPGLVIKKEENEAVGKIQLKQSSAETSAASKANAAKKAAKRVKWADHFGGSLEVAQVVEGTEVADSISEVSVSWSDRKKRDRMREKELLAKAKKAKILDDDDEGLDVPKAMAPSVAWRQPLLLPERTDVASPQLLSAEVSIQVERSKTISAARYASDYDVPPSPAPLTDVEQALDMTSQSSAIVATIPFFIPEQQQLPVEEPSVSHLNQTMHHVQTPVLPSIHIPQDNTATPEFVQALGLPMFLVGQNVQALQTLASSPSLLRTLLDANGAYDQPRLLSLVQTLSASTAAPTPAPPVSFADANGYYGSAQSASSYGTSQSTFPSLSTRTGYRGSSSDGNLHISGYGPGTTEADIIALFSPYVRVDEVVMKGTFAFVNTSDPVNAQLAKEALNGTLLMGMPVRINAAQRKNREAAAFGTSAPISAPIEQSFGSTAGRAPPPLVVPATAPVPTPTIPHLMTEQEVDAVRDDRGNPATKNLFVAGYGPGISEVQLRELFGLHAVVIGVVSKGTFSFVNTSDRAGAVRARDMLGGTMLNGGVLRINFAKETGRLGTSFDLTYGPNTGPNAQRNVGYYGRGF